MRQFNLLWVAGALAGCALAPPPAPAEPPPDKYIGMTKWVNPKFPVYVCDAPVNYSAGSLPACRTAKPGSPLTIEQATFLYKYDIQIPNGYAVTDATGARGFIKSTDPIMMLDEAERKQRDTEKADCDRRGGVRVGMTAAQVMATCWGKPKKVNETITGRGKHEQWVYGGGYLYLEDGILTSIQTSH